jgi:hypothetical protein
MYTLQYRPQRPRFRASDQHHLRQRQIQLQLQHCELRLAQILKR